MVKAKIKRRIFEFYVSLSMTKRYNSLNRIIISTEEKN